MVAILTSALMYAAEVFNIFTIFFVLAIFLFMTNFIMNMRLTADDFFGSSVVHVGHPPRVQIAVQKVEIPFFIQLLEPKNTSYQTVKIRIETKVPYILHAFWGLSSSYLTEGLAKSYENFYKHFIDDLRPDSYHYNEIRTYDNIKTNCDTNTNSCGTNTNSYTREIELKLESDITLGPPTRKSYPLVILLRKQQSTDSQITDVGASISVIHIKDDEMELSSCLLYQYIKQYSGQYSLLTPVYSEGGTTESDGEFEDGDINLEDACIICQVNRSSRVLLPCRHKCICGQCCNKLETCPMCRARIGAYFLTSPENYPPTEEKETVNRTHTSWWTQFNEFFNDFMRLD